VRQRIELLMKRPRDDDRGFTLIELLITIVIIGIIAVPLSDFVLSYFKNTTSTSARLSESHDAQIAATYFAQDAASVGTRISVAPDAALAQSVWTSTANGSGAYPCGNTGTALVLMVWDDVPAAGVITLGYNRVAYTLTSASGETQLHRIACRGSAVIVSDTVMAHGVDAANAPTVACDVACSGSGNATPTRVTLTISLKASGNTSGTDYVVALTGQRRST
jgi:prepilin-type N-terminal cleavage/methylation domain-containing protein